MGADEPQDTTGPSLEPPKLFRRRRKEPVEDTTAPEPAGAAAPPAAEPVAAEPEQTQVLDADLFVDSGADDAAQPVAAPVAVAQATRPPRAPRTPRARLVVPAQVAAPLVGLVTGIVLLGFMWVGFRGCEALSGTTSCGKGPGLLAITFVFGLTVFVGRVLLGLLKLPEPLMTSFLAVGISSLISVLVLGDLLDSAAILVVLPLLSAGTFALSWWIATLQVDLDD